MNIWKFVTLIYLVIAAFIQDVVSKAAKTVAKHAKKPVKKV